MTPQERARSWQQARRTEGRCPRCSAVVGDVNPLTKKPYWRCTVHRKEQREEASAAYVPVGSAGA